MLVQPCGARRLTMSWPNLAPTLNTVIKNQSFATCVTESTDVSRLGTCDVVLLDTKVSKVSACDAHERLSFLRTLPLSGGHHFPPLGIISYLNPPKIQWLRSTVVSKCPKRASITFPIAQRSTKASRPMMCTAREDLGAWQTARSFTKYEQEWKGALQL